jgi:3-dehydroquinate synthase
MYSNIILTNKVKTDLEGYLQGKQYSAICIIVDQNTEKHCFPLFSNLFENPLVISIPAGEKEKNLRTCEIIWQKMTDYQLDRKALVINLGGGVIGDMGGFCAATYKRGLDFIQIPTTLLSQVDASVGGKLGIDFNSFKNHIGVFQEPKAVLIDTTFLKTLPQEEIRSGFAEIIKHCLIADKEKWEDLKTKPFQDQNWTDLVAHSIAIKSRITQEDPKELGLRKILNFGHTIGHAIESYYLEIPDKRLLHGEAIGIGMIAEAYIAYKKGYINKDELEDIKLYILSVFKKIEIFEFDIEKLIPLTMQDKKNENKKIQCTLLEKIGEANFNNPINYNEIKEAINFYNL